jgi:hypothetical protein
MVLDISGAKSAMDGAAHAGYFVVNLGNAGIAIVRGRDGATQRYTLGGDWGYFLPAYVDETQIWFEHAATRAQSAGVARLALDPWP